MDMSNSLRIDRLRFQGMEVLALTIYPTDTPDSVSLAVSYSFHTPFSSRNVIHSPLVHSLVST